MARKTRFVTWNGKDLPAEFRELPAGPYVVEAVDDEAPLESDRQGGAVDVKRARQSIDTALGR